MKFIIGRDQKSESYLLVPRSPIGHPGWQSLRISALARSRCRPSFLGDEHHLDDRQLPMGVSEYLKCKDIAEFAKKVGVCESAVYYLMNGALRPRPDTALNIVKVTKEAVTLLEIYS